MLILSYRTLVTWPKPISKLHPRRMSALGDMMVSKFLHLQARFRLAYDTFANFPLILTFEEKRSAFVQGKIRRCIVQSVTGSYLINVRYFDILLVTVFSSDLGVCIFNIVDGQELLVFFK